MRVTVRVRVRVRVTGSGNESDVLLLGGRPTAPPGAAPLFKEEHRRLLSARPEGREQPRDPEHQEGPQGADHLLDQVGELLGQVDQPVDFEHGPAGALPAVQREGGELAAEVLHGIPTDAATREKVSAVSTLQIRSCCYVFIVPRGPGHSVCKPLQVGPLKVV